MYVEGGTGPPGRVRAAWVVERLGAKGPYRQKVSFWSKMVLIEIDAPMVFITFVDNFRVSSPT